MRRFRVWMQLEIKRYIKVFPWMFLAAIALALITSGIGLTGEKMFTAASAENVSDLIDEVTSNQEKETAPGAEETDGRLTVAMVVLDNSKAMKLAKAMIENIESITSLINLKYVDEQEGERMLADNEAVVMIIVREKTIAGIMNGRNTPIEVCFPENSGYEAAIFKEFADAAVNMLSSSQAAIYSIYDFYENYGKYRKVDDALERVNMAAITSVLTREKMFLEKEVLVTGNLSVKQYYICSGAVLFVIFFSIVFVNHFRSQRKEIGVWMKQSGMGYFAQVTASSAAAVIVYLFLFLPAGVGSCLLKSMKNGWEIWKEISYGQIWIMVFCMVLIAVVTSAFTLMICRLTDNVLAQVMILFTAAVLQGFVCGCFVPQILLPDVLGELAVVFPVYYMIEVISCIFTGEIPVRGIVGILTFTILFLAAAALAQSRDGNKTGRRKMA